MTAKRKDQKVMCFVLFFVVKEKEPPSKVAEKGKPEKSEGRDLGKGAGAGVPLAPRGEAAILMFGVCFDGKSVSGWG